MIDSDKVEIEKEREREREREAGWVRVQLLSTIQLNICHDFKRKHFQLQVWNLRINGGEFQVKQNLYWSILLNPTIKKKWFIYSNDLTITLGSHSFY